MYRSTTTDSIQAIAIAGKPNTAVSIGTESHDTGVANRQCILTMSADIIESFFYPWQYKHTFLIASHPEIAIHIIVERMDVQSVVGDIIYSNLHLRHCERLAVDVPQSRVVCTYKHLVCSVGNDTGHSKSCKSLNRIGNECFLIDAPRTACVITAPQVAIAAKRDEREVTVLRFIAAVYLARLAFLIYSYDTLLRTCPETSIAVLYHARHEIVSLAKDLWLHCQDTDLLELHLAIFLHQFQHAMS